jgi:hypothetical protein
LQYRKSRSVFERGKDTENEMALSQTGEWRAHLLIKAERLAQQVERTVVAVFRYSIAYQDGKS